mmetsp:Transcript_48727/g.114140  ORF Transcript_48727/g.114140 Transcript_48727/m.114140 type:complete len:200 (-) Transcript_48727:3452-4051(-)
MRLFGLISGSAHSRHYSRHSRYYRGGWFHAHAVKRLFAAFGSNNNHALAKAHRCDFEMAFTGMLGDEVNGNLLEDAANHHGASISCCIIQTSCHSLLILNAEVLGWKAKAMFCNDWHKAAARFCQFHKRLQHIRMCKQPVHTHRHNHINCPSIELLHTLEGFGSLIRVVHHERPQHIHKHEGSRSGFHVRKVIHYDVLP